ncbi:MULTISPECIES: hypothetical protein [Methylomonas]|uniref:hypothetical protein n=1 Tax=Methylomonas TaxID=416 RepID=UPI00123244A0|nr:hypothetical protein [Methylomonas rhizoryzae]
MIKKDLKLKKLFLAFSFILVTTNTQAYSISLNADRYLYSGNATDGTPCFDYQIGIFSAKNGFIASANFPSYACNEELTALDGLPIISLAFWSLYPKSALGGIKRSAQTYSIDEIEYVALYSKQAGLSNKPIVSVTYTGYLNQNQTSSNEDDAETENYGFFKVSLDRARTTEMTINFKLSGSAKKGQDYLVYLYDNANDQMQNITQENSITIPAGETDETIFILPVDDIKKEKKEKLKFSLKANPKIYKIGKPKSGTLQITDND